MTEKTGSRVPTAMAVFGYNLAGALLQVLECSEAAKRALLKDALAASARDAPALAPELEELAAELAANLGGRPQSTVQ